WLANDRVGHGHLDCGSNSPQVAVFTHLLCGLSYNFPQHGLDEIYKPEFIRLPEKIGYKTLVLAITSFARSQLIRWTDETQWQNIKVVHCGVDQRFLGPSRPVAESCKRLVYVGRLSRGKGLMLLLSAASLLVREGDHFELVLAGDGEMRARLEKSIATLGLSGFVRISGWLTNDQVRNEILEARALVMPSFAEGLPIVIMEAMALE